jgi:hypothetical protein
MKTHQAVPEQSGLAGLAAAIVILAALAWLALVNAPLPSPAPATAPAKQFSAARAFAHVEVLARSPRPIATSANSDAREYIIGRLRGVGLEPQVQVATVQKKSISPWEDVHVTLAVVRNILVRIPGSAPDHGSRPALLVTTHYDTGENTLGAASGGASVAAMLETARALRAGPALQNDVILLFADGGEVGALGAQAFVEQHPWARETGLALKFDNLGNRGPLVLYDSYGAGGDTIAGWASSAKGVRGSSLMREVYKLKWNRAEIGPFANAGAPVLQFATVDGVDGALDTPERLDMRTLQHEGDTMLGLARQFGDPRLERAVHDGEVYFELPRVGVVHYSNALVWPFTRLACLLLFAVSCLAIQRAGVQLVDIVKGAFGFPFIASLVAAAAWVLWQDFPALHEGYHRLAPGDHDDWYLISFAALGAGLFIILQRGLQKSIGAPAAALGAMACSALVLAGVSWAMPGASYVLAWPLLAALAAFAALHAYRVAALPQAARLLVLLAGTAPAVLLIAPAVREVFLALSPNRMNLPIALLALLLGLCIALLAQVARRFVVRGLLVAGIAFLGVARSAIPAPGDLPAPNPLTYYKDMPSWRAWWLAPPQPLDPWTRKVFPNLEEPRRFVDVFGWDSDDVWYAAAPRKDDLAFPHAIMLKNQEQPRQVEFMVTSKNRAPNIELEIRNGKPVRASVNGRLLTDTLSRTWSMSLYGMEDQPLHFVVDMQGHPTFTVQVRERIPGLPLRALPPRPASAKPALLPMTGTTVAADTLLFR